MYCENAHWNLVNPWDPDHCKLPGAGVVEADVAEPEGTDRRCLVLDSFETHNPRRVWKGESGFQVRATLLRVYKLLSTSTTPGEEVPVN